MPAVIMNTRSISSTLRQHMHQEVLTFSRQYNQTPGLVILGFGEDQSTIDFMRIMGRNAAEMGLRYAAQIFAANIKTSEIKRVIEHYNADPTVHAISLQLPLPRHLDPEEVASFIVPEKEVEGLHPLHIGRSHMGKGQMLPPPALSTMKLLSMYNINPAGRHVVIVGRNLEIGRPLSSIMTKADATVTLCHSLTNNLQAHTRQAEILITAVGQPGIIKAEMVRPGAVVIDYGINYVSKGSVVGDTDFERVANVAGAITPMPGGTGPLTIICLVENILKAARLQISLERNSPKAVVETEPFNFRPASAEPELSGEMRPGLMPPRNEAVIRSDTPTRAGYFH